MFGVLSSRRTEPVVPERDRPTMDPRLVALAGLISAIAFVIIVLPGLASDEPSHWQTVLDYGRYLHLPRLGTPGVSYEAQQGPVAYVVGGIIYRLTHALIGPAGAFYTVRVLGALEFAALILLGLRLVRQTATSRLGVTAALVYLGLNPMLLAMFSSVQNDGLCLLLGFGALAYVLSRSPGTIAVGDCSADGKLDLGCVLGNGSFETDLDNTEMTKIVDTATALVSFTLTLLRRLQGLGSAPAIDFDAYSAWVGLQPGDEAN